jgi:hypothetical protein
VGGWANSAALTAFTRRLTSARSGEGQWHKPIKRTLGFRAMDYALMVDSQKSLPSPCMYVDLFTAHYFTFISSLSDACDIQR